MRKKEKVRLAVLDDSVEGERISLNELIGSTNHLTIEKRAQLYLI